MKLDIEDVNRSSAIYIVFFGNPFYHQFHLRLGQSESFGIVKNLIGVE